MEHVNDPLSLYDAGYAAGFDKGYQTGFDEGVEQGLEEIDGRIGKLWAEIQTLHARVDYLSRENNND